MYDGTLWMYHGTFTLYHGILVPFPYEIYYGIFKYFTMLVLCTSPTILPESIRNSDYSSPKG